MRFMALDTGLTLRMAVLGAWTILASGCGGSQPRATPIPTQPTEHTSSTVVALIENTPVYAADLTPTLFELAGREALRERVLDQALRAELERASTSVSTADIERERALFEERMTRPGEDRATNLVADEIYRSRSLGPERRRAMFWRNAALRKLATDEVPVTSADIDAAMELAYGPKVIARVIVTETERDAGTVLNLLGPRPSVSDFARLAEQRSIDPTASRGGQLMPMHLADANYPLAVREALGRMSPGSLSPIIPLANGSAIVMLEGRQAASTPPTGAAERLERELTVQNKRAAMDALARRLVGGARVDVLDRSLGWSWDRR